MSDPAKKSCTIRELARHVGLSTCTVSRVLNHRGGELPIPEKTQERIREAARALNYVPNVNAQRFFKRRSNVIGLLVPPQEEMGHNAFNDTHTSSRFSPASKRRSAGPATICFCCSTARNFRRTTTMPGCSSRAFSTGS